MVAEQIYALFGFRFVDNLNHWKQAFEIFKYKSYKCLQVLYHTLSYISYYKSSVGVKLQYYIQKFKVIKDHLMKFPYCEQRYCGRVTTNRTKYSKIGCII